MNSPVKHHFNPAFSLKPWAGTDGQLCEMKRINGNVVPRRAHPKATGFQKNLYRTDGVGAEYEQHLELNVMKPLDTAAERALKKILSGTRRYGIPRSAAPGRDTFFRCCFGIRRLCRD